MRCRECFNKTEFTMTLQAESWNDKTKKFENMTQSDGYIVCDKCDSTNIDTEGDY